ncbi:hypothetical protein EC968_007519 [Mortierella alpina]|nr:hypothetical protein EC968_007519 [Mortierella alpina]
MSEKKSTTPQLTAIKFTGLAAKAKGGEAANVQAKSNGTPCLSGCREMDAVDDSFIESTPNLLTVATVPAMASTPEYALRTILQEANDSVKPKVPLDPRVLSTAIYNIKKSRRRPQNAVDRIGPRPSVTDNASNMKSMANLLQTYTQDSRNGCCKTLNASPPDEPLQPGTEEQVGQELFNVDFGNDDSTEDTESEAEHWGEDDETLIGYGPSYVETHGNPVRKLRDGIVKLR